MMDIPPEIQYMIISFLPSSSLKLVCKNWANEIKIIQKRAVGIIGKWFYTKRIPKNPSTLYELIRCYTANYPTEQLMAYPKFAVRKLYLNEDLLDVLPPMETIKRSDVITWMKNMPLTYNEWCYVGW